ncbi:MAG: LD-carboxypeptidase [Victivallales bacterium]|nr:LD-carboxypeptidase [Victivallales bacterium]
MTDVPRKTKKIGLFAIANAGDSEKEKIGIKNFQEYTGMEILPYSVTSPGPRRFAGDDESRAKRFNALLNEPELDGLVAIRGGYGTTRILEQIDFEALRRKDCFVCGYSDITALLLAAWKHGCRKLIHGPMIHSSWAIDPSSPTFQIEAESFLRVQGTGYRVQGLGKRPKDFYDNLKEPNKQPGEITQAISPLSTCTLYPVPCTLLSQPSFLKSDCTLYPVPCTLIPMNLTLLCALLGTPFMPDLTGTILALEDISAPAHDIDRKLNQLRQAGILQHLAGLIFGQFTDAEDSEFLPEIRREYAEYVPGPVIENFPFGHSHPSLALPFGEPVTLSISTDYSPNLTWHKN